MATLTYKTRKVGIKLGTGEYGNGTKEITKSFSLSGIRSAADADSIASVMLAIDDLLMYTVSEITVAKTDVLTI